MPELAGLNPSPGYPQVSTNALKESPKPAEPTPRAGRAKTLKP
jgi:hypothetical protein